MEIAPKLWRIPLPLPRMAGAERLGIVNLYLVGGERWCLIDAGMDNLESMHALEAGLRRAGIGLRDLDILALSHSHPDHYGMSRRIREASGATVCMHRDELEWFFRGIFADEPPADWLVRNGAPRFEMTMLMAMAGPGFKPTAPDRMVADGDTIDLGGRSLEVIFTPGHTPGHCCFALPDEGIVITQDHVLPKITPHIGLFPGSVGNPLQDYSDSLARIASRRFRLALPAHGDPISDVSGRIRRIERHHIERLAKVAAALDEPRTAWDIVPDVFGELPDFHRVAALFETAAHLEWGAARGTVRRIDRGGVDYWAS